MCRQGSMTMSQSTAGEGTTAQPAANSGSQYALCALGVGLVALGIVMIVWSVVPVDGTTNSSRPGLDAQGRTSSVAFVLVGAGVTMLLLSLCLGIRNKQRRAGEPAHGLPTAYDTQASIEDSAHVLEERFTVPSYDEVVGGSAPFPSDTPPAGRSNSASQLPSYEDVLEGGQVVVVDVSLPQPNAATGGRWNGRATHKLLPLKIRSIKSEKLRLKGASSAPNSPQPVTVFSIEPLTPPPQYDDKPPQL
ncbi:transmembrane protein 51a isoform X1 [Alosa sapidissima]|uniref:transmembrane protein 51a isoform X1 n=2 Tax=Alosa sapidissima TaxID=34773 RepID=UPI001C085C5F|nr:transmembrane protein 51a isoform X1 [Alosa sapidissima]